MTTAQSPTIKCLGCGWTKMTWREQRQQYGRAIRRGLSADEAKKLMPRCQKCVTEILGNGRPHGRRST
jgi:hypothetical protein